ncbi:site-specific DNA-methyltransferase [Carnobacteriaceae bacterium zg-C25]|nr:site-specific DNA-methyltransferase [Carnobacteriaceae bacterium zg-C25]
MKKELERLLAQNDTFMVEGVLNKNKLSELARQYNPELLNLLMSDKKISQHFFATLETGVLVFKKDIFLQFLNNKEFLPDSFTAYKTKIGLATGDKYLSENQEVVLNFPYKDCVLEGGQTKDDAKRQEIFFNETLAPTEINRLLDDKVLTNFKRYDETGEHEVEELKDTDNLIIKGNNLIALHSLKKRFAGKVKLIYIDPPYNTGNDSFNYNDSFNHSTWLTFMKNRLEVAKELLSDEGSIWINLDDNEAHYCKILCDEVFGRENFIHNIVWQHRKSVQSDIVVSLSHNHLLVYAKSANNLKLNRSKDVNENAFSNPDNDPRGAWKVTPFDAPNIRPNLTYPITNPNTGETYLPPEGRCWRTTQDEYNRLLQENRIVFGKTGNSKPQAKLFLSEVQAKGVSIKTWWDDCGTATEATKELQKLFEAKNIFSTPKPEKLLQRIIELSTNSNDIVLDYHLGSGTTTAVAHKMNRQYIGIEQMDYIETVSVERLKKVIAGEQGGISKDVNWSGGGSFVYAELKNDAQDFKNQILEATTTEELLELFELAKKSSFLSYRIDPKKLKKAEFEKLSLAEQKQILSEIIDKNNLYVNYADMDDSDYGISAQDKKLNHAFYGKEK